VARAVFVIAGSLAKLEGDAADARDSR